LIAIKAQVPRRDAASFRTVRLINELPETSAIRKPMP
jgi:hypothetical protein